MKELVRNFSTQLQEALIIAQNYKFITPQKEFANVVLTGLGGSGIGGSIVQNYSFNKLKIPFVVNKDYFLPAFVNAKTLLLVCSYSGNTEETLQAMQQGLKAKATIVCITSGGKVAEIARKKKLDCILLPAGMPPRSCIGYSLVQILAALNYFNLLSADYIKETKAAIKLLNADEKAIQRTALQLAKKLHHKLPVIYSGAELEGLSVRIRQQLNENGKILCWHNIIPEMNHNELVGWRDKDNDKVVIILKNDADYDNVKMRMKLNKDVIKKYTKNIIELEPKGKTFWEKVYYLIHLTDWASVYLADLRNMNATEVKVIDELKKALAKA